MDKDTLAKLIDEAKRFEESAKKDYDEYEDSQSHGSWLKWNSVVSWLTKKYIDAAEV